MAATNRYMNHTATFTPSGGSLTTIDGIKSVSYDEGISIKKEAGSADSFSTVSVRDHAEPVITIDTINAFILYATLAGVRGPLAVTARDAYNGATVGEGAKLITMSNAQIEDRKIMGKHREYGTQQLKFGCISSDGSTHPVAITAV